MILLFPCHVTYGQNVPYASGGIIDVRAWNFDEGRLALNGYWNFKYQKLVSPAQCAQNKTGVYEYFPRLWNETRGNGEGYGTYCLKIIVPPAIDTFSISLPQLYCSYTLWAGDRKIASNGSVGKSRQETIPQWLPQTVTFPVLSDTINLTLQLANFHHHKGGARESIYLGLPGNMLLQRSITLAGNHVSTLFFGLSGMVFLMLYFTKGKKNVILYFSLLCLTLCVRSMFSNVYTFINFFPDFGWAWTVRIEYLTLYLINIFAVLFITYLFNNVTQTGIKYFLVTANILFILITVFFSPVFFTRWMNLYLIFSSLTILYAAASIIRAIIREQSGAWFLVTSLSLSAFTFTYDMISYEWRFPYNPVILNACYILIFLFTGLALLKHLGIIKNKKTHAGDILRYSDLYKEDTHNYP